jgi:hypothetical protein
MILIVIVIIVLVLVQGIIPSKVLDVNFDSKSI